MGHDERGVGWERLELAETSVESAGEVCHGVAWCCYSAGPTLTGMLQMAAEGRSAIQPNEPVSTFRPTGPDSVPRPGNRASVTCQGESGTIRAIFVLTHAYSFLTSMLPSLRSRSRNQLRRCDNLSWVCSARHASSSMSHMADCQPALV
jgi:hypothetical protein